jgi:hypothetical protein
MFQVLERRAVNPELNRSWQQIHRLENGSTTVYSRNSENMSGRYPDVMEKIAKVKKQVLNDAGCNDSNLTKITFSSGLHLERNLLFLTVKP